MASRKGFAVFDGDSHVVEPREVWEKYLEPEYRVPGKLALWREEGKHGSYLKVNGEVFRDTEDLSHIPSHAIWRPGMTWDAIGDLDPQVHHPANEAAWNPQARLRDMDAMGVDQAFLYPTWFAEGFPLVKDPDVAYALARAYNNWITDFCKAGPDRLFAAAILPLQNIDFALEELRRIAKIPCFRGVFIRPAFVEDRYPESPVLRAAVGGTGKPGRCRRGSFHAGTVESGMDLARTIHRKGQGPPHAEAAAFLAPAQGQPRAAAARCSRSPGFRLDIPCRRSFRTGWTTTCSWDRRCWDIP